MFLAMVDDVRVVLIKLADRLHNMRTLEHMPEDKQLRSARETIEIYAPLANRLGISQIRSELEDLAFRYLNPQQYFSIDRAIDRRTSDRVDFLDRFEEDIVEHFADAGIHAELQKREKHLFSIWKKMERKDVSFDEIYDVFGFRIIVDRQAEIATRPWELSTPTGTRFRVSSTTISPPRKNRCTNRFTRQLSDRAARRSRSRFGRVKCTALPNTASPHTGATKNRARSTITSSVRWHGCGTSWTGATRSPTHRSLSNR